MTTSPLLEVDGLGVTFSTPRGEIRVVDDVSFDIAAGECVGLIGESGSGKSVTALSLVRLLSRASYEGRVRFDGRDLLDLAEAELKQVRGGRIGFVFQDPMACLNPALTIGFQVAEPARLHLGMSKKESLDHAAELLDRVGIARARDRLRDHPHQLSGGMRQRVMIAIALAARPGLIIADEPTTALDVTIQAQILDLIREVSTQTDAAVLMITHDLGIAAGLCDRVNVMYAGQIVERAGTSELFAAPEMPYTWGLLDSLPRMDDPRGTRLRSIPGSPPTPPAVSDRCRFLPRCPYSRDRCGETAPVLTERVDGHTARCLGTEPMGWIA